MKVQQHAFNLQTERHTYTHDQPHTHTHTLLKTLLILKLICVTILIVFVRMVLSLYSSNWQSRILFLQVYSIFMEFFIFWVLFGPGLPVFRCITLNVNRLIMAMDGFVLILSSGIDQVFFLRYKLWTVSCIRFGWSSFLSLDTRFDCRLCYFNCFVSFVGFNFFQVFQHLFLVGFQSFLQVTFYGHVLCLSFSWKQRSAPCF